MSVLQKPPKKPIGLQSIFKLWIYLSILIGLEFLALRYQSKYSLLLYLQKHYHLWPDKKLNVEVGKTVSYALGWIGITVILLTNPYILRKRIGFMNKWGYLPNWFSFHLLCGLLGPTFIIFHTNFKVGGLVAISFWSMMIVATSGIMGSYFYLQVLAKKDELNNEVQHWERVLKKMRDKYAPSVTDDSLNKTKKEALLFAGVFMAPDEVGILSLPSIFIRSTLSDIKLLFRDPMTAPGMPPKSRVVLTNYAIGVRKIYLIKPFQLMLSYWHAFHVPFTIVMYIAAAIHIFVALMFQV